MFKLDFIVDILSIFCSEILSERLTKTMPYCHIPCFAIKTCPRQYNSYALKQQLLYKKKINKKKRTTKYFYLNDNEFYCSFVLYRILCHVSQGTALNCIIVALELQIFISLYIQHICCHFHMLLL